MYLALAAIVKDEPAAYLREWVAYHLLLGVEQVYLCDNESALPVASVFKNEARVTVTSVAGPAQQLPTYGSLCRKLSGQARWVLFLDADEFIRPLEEKTIPDVLRKYETAASVSFNWRVFGNYEGCEDRVPSVLGAFAHRAPLDYPVNQHVKTAVCPECVFGWRDPHLPDLCLGKRSIRPDGSLASSPCAPPVWEGAVIHHYWVRSVTDWRDKIIRGRGDITLAKDQYDSVGAAQLNRIANILDTTMLRYTTPVCEEAERIERNAATKCCSL